MDFLDDVITLDETRELEESLIARPDAMLMEEAHGFLAALVSGPSSLPLGTWVPVLLGAGSDATPITNRLIKLILKFRSMVVADLEDGREVCATGEDADSIIDWCSGYITGVRMDPTWREDDIGMSLALPLGVICGAFDLRGELGEGGEVIEDPSEHIRLYLDTYPERVMDAYDYWADVREGGAFEAVSLRIGRNEPCPCKSGKKYKRCCGLP